MKIGPGVENRPLPLTRPMAYTTASTTVQAVIIVYQSVNSSSHSVIGDIEIQWEWSNFDHS